MSKLLISAILCTSLAAPALAETIKFSREGISYSATVRTVGDSQIISGRETKSGKPFRLRVANGKVTGIYGASHVAYPVPSNTQPVVTASR